MFSNCCRVAIHCVRTNSRGAVLASPAQNNKPIQNTRAHSSLDTLAGSKVRYRDELPEAVDVAVIGGGVIGVFSTYILVLGAQLLYLKR